MVVSMKYGILFPRDNRKLYYVLYMEGPNESKPFRLKDEYLTFRCVVCGKVDSERAVRAIPPVDAVLDCRRDYFELSEGLVAVSSRFAQLVLDEAIGGVEFMYISDSHYALMLPTMRVKLDTIEGVRLLDKCSACGQYKSSVGFPKIPDSNVPDNCIFLTQVALAGPRAENCVFFASPAVCDTLQRAKVRGLFIDRKMHNPRM
jgi:hypothetical protein